MHFPELFCARLKWTIYDWIGSLTRRELVSNQELSRQVEALCRRLSAIAT